MSREDEIREREQKATKGPWWFDYTAYQMRGRKDVCVTEDIISPDDQTFIAHAREDVPWLLSEVARLRRELEETRELCRKSVGRLVGTIDSQGRPVVKDCLTAEVPKETP